MVDVRPYEESHPWITFDARALNEVHQRLWMLLAGPSWLCRERGSFWQVSRGLWGFGV